MHSRGKFKIKEKWWLKVRIDICPPCFVNFWKISNWKSRSSLWHKFLNSGAGSSWKLWICLPCFNISLNMDFWRSRSRGRLEIMEERLLIQFPTSSSADASSHQPPSNKQINQKKNKSPTSLRPTSHSPIPNYQTKTDRRFIFLMKLTHFSLICFRNCPP